MIDLIFSRANSGGETIVPTATLTQGHAVFQQVSFSFPARKVTLTDQDGLRTWNKKRWWQLNGSD